MKNKKYGVTTKLIPFFYKIYYHIRLKFVSKIRGAYGVSEEIRWMSYDKIRVHFLKKYGAKISKGVNIKIGFHLHCPRLPFSNLIIGENAYIDNDVLIDISDKFFIGANSRIACGTKIYTHFASHYRGDMFVDYHQAPVYIGEDSRCSPNTMISCGTVVGNRVLIGANSFVKANSILQDNSLYGGVPAKLIKKYNG